MSGGQSNKREHPRLYKRGSVWWCWYYNLNRKQVCESTRCTDQDAASIYLAQREREAQNPADSAQAKATLEQALDGLIDERTQRTTARTKSGSEETIEFYKQKSGHWLRILGRKFLIKYLSAGDVDKFIKKRREETATDNTIHKELVTLRAALKLAKRAGIWSGDIAAILPVGFSSGYKPKERWLPLHEVLQVTAQLQPDYAARVAFSAATGAEWNALERAQRVDITDEYVHLRGTKRESRDRNVPIVAEWQRALLKFVKEKAAGTTTLFTPWDHRNSLRTFKSVSKRLGIPCFSWNDLRRSFGQWIRRGGVTYDTLAPVMGHANSKITESVYAHLNDSGVADRLKAELKETTDCSNIVVNSASPVVHKVRMLQVDNQNTARIPGESSALDPIRTGDLRIRSPKILITSARKKAVKTKSQKQTVVNK